MKIIKRIGQILLVLILVLYITVVIYGIFLDAAIAGSNPYINLLAFLLVVAVAFVKVNDWRKKR